MSSATQAGPAQDTRRNAFGFLRLFFASLVIVSHTPEMVDGTREREPLTLLFGTISFGDLAVDAFFIISGYLITASFLSRPQIVPYLWRRIGRIYPGFLVATFVSLFIVAPLAGTTPESLLQWSGRSIARIVFLKMPYLPDVFLDNPLTLLNGPMWTIAYEFRCYLLVIALALAGLFRSPGLVALASAAMLSAAVLLPEPVFEAVDSIFPHSTFIFGRLEETLRLTGMFLAGSFFLLRPALIPRGPATLGACAAGLLACLSQPMLAGIGVAVFGAALIFGVAFGGQGRLIDRINVRSDISYGAYLYAWPFEQLLIAHFPQLSLVELCLATLAFALAAGWLSWTLVERRALQAAQKIEWPAFRRRGIESAA